MHYKSKHEKLYSISCKLGITQLLSKIPQDGNIIVLNYHRIGNRFYSDFDRNAFSATQEDFHMHIKYLSSHYHIATLNEVIYAISNKKKQKYNSFLITFDDGYIDNYKLAFPVLKANNKHGVFFIPTAYIGSNNIPWWDIIAFCIRHCTKKSIVIENNKITTLTSTDKEKAISTILTRYKSLMITEISDFLNHIMQASEVEPPLSTTNRLFMNWEEVRELTQHGMAIGSHTHRHHLLSQLPEDKQKEELLTSKNLIESETGQREIALAYPVGSPHSFTKNTMTILQDLKYAAAFSFYGGINTQQSSEIFDIKRVAIEDKYSPCKFKLKTAIASAFGIWN